MGDRERRLDALTAKVTKLLAPAATTDALGEALPAFDRLHIVAVSSGASPRAEWERRAEEMEGWRVGRRASEDAREAFATVEGALGAAVAPAARRLDISYSLTAWEPPSDPPEPPPLPRPRPFVRPDEAEPPAPVGRPEPVPSRPASDADALWKAWAL
jgi:hypothetical protein